MRPTPLQGALLMMGGLLTIAAVSLLARCYILDARKRRTEAALAARVPPAKSAAEDCVLDIRAIERDAGGLATTPRLGDAYLPARIQSKAALAEKMANRTPSITSSSSSELSREQSREQFRGSSRSSASDATPPLNPHRIGEAANASPEDLRLLSEISAISRRAEAAEAARVLVALDASGAAPCARHPTGLPITVPSGQPPTEPSGSRQSSHTGRQKKRRSGGRDRKDDRSHRSQSGSRSLRRGSKEEEASMPVAEEELAC